MSLRLLWAGLALMACSSPPPAPTAPTGPRFVSLTPAITETVHALGAADRLVGRSDWCSTPEAARQLTPMGSALTPNFEAIAVARPTAVFVDHSQGVPEDELSALAPVERYPWLTVDDVAQSVTALGERVGQPDKAQALASRLQTTLKAAPPAGGPTVLLALDGEAPTEGEVWYIRKNSLHGAALHAAGYRHAVDRDIKGAAMLSTEALLALNPDIVVVLSTEAASEARDTRIREAWAPLTPLKAVTDKQLYIVGSPTTLSTGPSILTTTERLKEALPTP